MKNCVIIGGGVIGLCSAYYLAKEGHVVTIIDQSDFKNGCSYGNAGMIVPSHVIPLAQPGMIAQGIKWMFDSKSPFYVKPRFNKELFSWGLSFYKHANQKHVDRSMPALRDLSFLSKELYQQFTVESDSFEYQEKGLLMLFQSDKVGEEETHAGKEAQKLGLEVDFLNQSEVFSLESGLNINAIGGVHYKSDAHLSPNRFMAFLISELGRMKVNFITNSSVTDFKVEAGKIADIITTTGIIKCDEVVLSAGSWSPKIAKKLGINLSILPGKGYSFNIENREAKPSIPSILCEGKVAVTPMGNKIRFGGTMEITHTNDHTINTKRVQGIVDTANKFYPEIQLLQPPSNEIWHGFRPCTPSGLPLISRSEKVKNVIIAAGHGMMGLSLAPATGKLVQEMVNNKETSVDVSQFGL